jgi:hypothetical protein
MLNRSQYRIYIYQIAPFTDEVGAPAPAAAPAEEAEEGLMQTRAQCRQVLFPCKDNKCYCCIGGGTRQCYATQAECRHACP